MALAVSDRPKRQKTDDQGRCTHFPTDGGVEAILDRLFASQHFVTRQIWSDRRPDLENSSARHGISLRLSNTQNPPKEFHPLIIFGAPKMQSSACRLTSAICFITYATGLLTIHPRFVVSFQHNEPPILNSRYRLFQWPVEVNQMLKTTTRIPAIVADEWILL